MSDSEVTYVDADQSLQERLRAEWGPVVARHVHLADGFTIVAVAAGCPVGVLAVQWRHLPPPLPQSLEAFIDIIEVREEFRRRGIARQMVEAAAARAQACGACQLRAWSSNDKVQAVAMWKALGFGLCPAAVYPRGQEVHGFFVAKRLG